MRFLRLCCVGRVRVRGSDFVWCPEGRRVDGSGAGGEVGGLPDVAAHRANGSTPASESGFSPAGEGNAAFVGSVTGAR